MSKQTYSIEERGWKDYEKVIFRIIFLYFLIQIIPIDWTFFKQISSFRLSSFGYADIFNLAHYTPDFLPGPDSFGNWVLALLLAVAGTILWSQFEKNKERDYNKLQYWLRVLLRYRLAIALFAYGFIKFFPLQSPFPSLSNLSTNYGDYNRWKLFSLSLGIVPSYQSFLGGAEIVLGLLLLYRKTASIAAFIVIVFTGNVFMSNIAYDGGEVVYSFFLLTLAFFILLPDLQRLNRLLILQKPTSPNTYHPLVPAGWQQYARYTVKALFIFFFVVIYGFQARQAYKYDPYQYPSSKGLSKATGIYNVSSFVLNNDSIGYSLTNPVRWKDVIFEKWNTISIRSNRPVIPDTSNTDYIFSEDARRTYELEGSAGRHYYSYTVDTSHQELILKNRNRNYKNELLKLSYRFPNDSTILLSGIDQNSDSVRATLSRLNKKFLLEVVAREGRRKSLKL